MTQREEKEGSHASDGDPKRPWLSTWRWAKIGLSRAKGVFILSACLDRQSKWDRVRKPAGCVALSFLGLAGGRLARIADRSCPAGLLTRSGRAGMAGALGRRSSPAIPQKRRKERRSSSDDAGRAGPAKTKPFLTNRPLRHDLYCPRKAHRISNLCRWLRPPAHGHPNCRSDCSYLVGLIQEAILFH